MKKEKAGPFLILPSTPRPLQMDTISLKSDQDFSAASSFSLGGSREAKAKKQHGGGFKGRCGCRAHQ
ncbi:hypothetical protein EG833_03890 [archaeon]|nr:hypothetical protein [archaeon]